MYSLQYIVVYVKLETYKQLMRAVAAAMGLIIAVGVVVNNIAITLIGLTAGMLVLYLARREVTERSYDERTVIINQKSSQATLSITVTSLAVVGLSLILLSGQGYLGYEVLGFQLAMLSLLVMALKAFFDWYYRNRFGG